MTGRAAPVVSVIIPFYDRADVLHRALRSVHEQDLEGTVETIVVIDGSSEDLNWLKLEFPLVTYLSQKNRGPGAARNRGLLEARGEFVAFLDADDRWTPSKLRTQIQVMRARDSAWSQHSYRVVDTRLEVIRHVDTSRYTGDVLRDTLLSFRVQTSTVMVRRQCLVNSRIRFSSARAGEDGYFYTLMAAKYPLTAVSQELGYFTWHGANAGGQPDVQLWSRNKTWTLNRAEIDAALPLIGRVAYKWCALMTRLLRYPQNVPPTQHSRTAAGIAYAPSYLIFQLLARRYRP